MLLARNWYAGAAIKIIEMRQSPGFYRCSEVLLFYVHTNQYRFRLRVCLGLDLFKFLWSPYN